MKAIVICIVSVLVATSCLKKDDMSTTNNNFDYSTSKEVVVASSTQTRSDLFNQKGDLIAQNVLGNTPLVVASGDVITARASANAGEPTIISFPSDNKYATMWFEDLFPSRGDYDMNDIAIGFRYDFILDQDGFVDIMRIHIQPRAVGSGFEKIGLAIQFRDMQVLIKSIEGSGIGGLSSLFEVDKIGVELTDVNAREVVVPITESLRGHFTKGSGGQINVYNDGVINEGKEFVVNIIFDKKVYYNDITIFGTNPRKYNIDLFAIFDVRGKEVHVKGMAPTTKFDKGYFKQVGRADFSDRQNYIWALMIPQSVSHPIEKSRVESSYPRFKQWIESKGAQAEDWYNYPAQEFVYKTRY